MFGLPSKDDLQQLFAECKRYIDLQKDYAKLDLTEKLTILLSRLILVVALLILGMMVLFYLSFTLAYLLEPLVGSLKWSFAIISALLLILFGVVYFFRKPLIVNPVVNFVGNLLLKEETDEPEEVGEEAEVSEEIIIPEPLAGEGEADNTEA